MMFVIIKAICHKAEMPISKALDPNSAKDSPGAIALIGRESGATLWRVRH
jgi:hypothetical protein